MVKNKALLLNGKHNLFSISKIIYDNGQKLGGDSNAVWITMDNKKIVFDIEVTTPKGVVHCEHF